MKYTRFRWSHRRGLSAVSLFYAVFSLALVLMIFVAHRQTVTATNSSTEGGCHPYELLGAASEHVSDSTPPQALSKSTATTVRTTTTTTTTTLPGYKVEASNILYVALAGLVVLVLAFVALIYVIRAR